jgi:hypothetical protein
VSTTADPAARTPGRHASPEREITRLEGQWLALRAAALIDRYGAMVSASSGAAMTPEDLLEALAKWATEALDVLREVTR